MRIVLGADHNGVEFKKILIKHLAEIGHEVVDVGPDSTDSVDYPDYAFAAAEMVAKGEADRGVLICGSGAGMSMAANKVAGVRAAVCLSPEAARLARGHNDANVLVLAGWQNDSGDVLEVLDSFLEGEFDGGRHARRIDKIKAYEDGKRKP
jgi:RpiB/LacA/LacB family sugar-phosphate isomerase